MSHPVEKIQNLKDKRNEVLSKYEMIKDKSSSRANMLYKQYEDLSKDIQKLQNNTTKEQKPKDDGKKKEQLKAIQKQMDSIGEKISKLEDQIERYENAGKITQAGIAGEKLEELKKKMEELLRKEQDVIG